jgi:sugar/nucleoside kinase (ribokinase family)
LWLSLKCGRPSSAVTNPAKSWEEHFRFAQAASAHKIQHLGNEAGLPTLAEIAVVRREFEAPS